MGIFALDNISHLAHQTLEPRVEEHYDYDEYAIYENGRIIATFGAGAIQNAWGMARNKFLRLFCIEKRAVKLFGRVFN
jgi:hypothetical protein